MNDVWEQLAPQQRLTELIKLLNEQKEKEQEQLAREIDKDKKSAERTIQLTQLIEILTKHVLELEKRVLELEKKK